VAARQERAGGPIEVQQLDCNQYTQAFFGDFKRCGADQGRQCAFLQAAAKNAYYGHSEYACARSTLDLPNIRNLVVQAFTKEDVYTYWFVGSSYLGGGVGTLHSAMMCSYFALCAGARRMQAHLCVECQTYDIR
jgi:hypothetical protein